jgi:uncharacterized membrane protein
VQALRQHGRRRWLLSHTDRSSAEDVSAVVALVVRHDIPVGLEVVERVLAVVVAMLIGVGTLAQLLLRAAFGAVVVSRGWHIVGFHRQHTTTPDVWVMVHHISSALIMRVLHLSSVFSRITVVNDVLAYIREMFIFGG